jgi:Spy/CpxP family protein refolding chaperone
MAGAGAVRRLPALAACAALLCLAAPGRAEPPDERPHPRRSPAGFIEEHAERLGLDAETRAAIQAISSESRAAEQELRGRIHGAHERMRELLDEDAPEASAVMAQAEVIGALETEARKERLAAMLRIRKLLTPEQRAELVRIREELGPPRWRRWKGRAGPGPGPPPAEP